MTKSNTSVVAIATRRAEHPMSAPPLVADAEHRIEIEYRSAILMIPGRPDREIGVIIERKVRLAA